MQTIDLQQTPYALWQKWGNKLFLPGIILTWTILWYVALALNSAQLWFPPAALTVALFLVYGPKAYFPAFLAVSFGTLQSELLLSSTTNAMQIIGTALGCGFIHCIVFGLPISWMHGQARPSYDITRPRDSTLFLALLPPVTLVGAFLAYYGTHVMHGSLPADPLAEILNWWVGHLVAIVTLAPAMAYGLYWLHKQGIGLPGETLFKGDKLADHDRENWNLCTFKVLLTALVFWGYNSLSVASNGALPASFIVYLMLLPVMWIAHTHSARQTLATIATFSTLMIVITNVAPNQQRALDYQLALLALATVGYFSLSIPQLLADNRALSKLANVDSLTGMLRRRRFIERANEEVERARRYDSDLCLMMMDIDNFKTFNDRFGHAMGDRILQQLADACRAHMREYDLMGRLGGEEFGILMPNTDLVGAEHLADRLRDIVSKVSVKKDDQQLTVTVSIGLTPIYTRQEHYDEAMARADHALYQAKDSGRNRVIVVDRPDEEK